MIKILLEKKSVTQYNFLRMSSVWGHHSSVCGKYLHGLEHICAWWVSLQDSQLVVEAYKSGFEPPGDIEFEDYTQPMKRTVSDNSLSNSRGEGKSELKFGGKSKGKLWPFIKKNKVLMTGPSVMWVLQGVEMFICLLVFKGTKSFKLVVSECKQKASVLFHFKAISLFGGGTLAVAFYLISDAFITCTVSPTLTAYWPRAVPHHAFHS